MDYFKKQKCVACRKEKRFCKQRTYQLTTPAIEVKSDGKLCGSCYRKLTKFVVK